MHNYKNEQNSGFTLIELAIAIVIIGLLISGIVAGQSIITSAKRQDFIADLRKFDTAIKAFELEYNGVPGDFREANDFWASATSGDGDHMIETDAEAHQAWLHMNLAGIMPGTFSGAGAVYTAGVNAPELPYDNTTAALMTIAAYSWGDGSVISTRFKPREIGVTIIPSGLAVDDGDDLNTTTITGRDGYYIDKKIDDGLPGTGKMVSVACDDSGEMEWQGWEAEIASIVAYDLNGTDNCSSIISLQINK